MTISAIVGETAADMKFHRPRGDATSLLVFSDDWGRHPSSCQHLVYRLLDRYPTLWVNTIGTRSPKWDLQTLRRGWEKLTQWSGGDAAPSYPANLKVTSPRMWPWMTSAMGRRLNRWLLTRQLLPWIRRQQRVVALTTIPIVADLIDTLGCKHWVYYCVDDLGAWPGLEHDLLSTMERSLVERVDSIVAVSQHLRERIAGMGRDAELLTHGVDLDHWRAEPNAALGIDAPQPWVVFWGLIDPRLDLDWIAQLAAELEQGTVLLVGPTQNPPPGIEKIPRVQLVPSLPHDLLPSLGREARVLIMPYADLPVTRAMQPLKLKEYLATGRPVVTSHLPAVAEWRDCLDVAESAGQFSDLVRERIATGLPEDQSSARARLQNESWESKARQLADVIERLSRVDAPGQGTRKDG